MGPSSVGRALGECALVLSLLPETDITTLSPLGSTEAQSDITGTLFGTDLWWCNEGETVDEINLD